MSSRIVNYLLLFAAGLLTGTVGSITQQSTVTIGKVTVPWGEILGLAAIAFLLAGLRLVNDTRWYALAAAVGVLIPVGLFSLQSAGGSVLIPNDSIGVAWLWGSGIICVVLVAVPGLPRPREVHQNGIS